MRFLAAVGMVLAAAVSGPLELVTGGQATAPGSQQRATAVPRSAPATGLVVQRIWTTERLSGRTVQLSPDPGHVLMVLDLTAVGQAPVSVHLDQLVAVGASTKVAPVGAAPLSPSNFDVFAGFVSGWTISTDAQNREIKIGRDRQDQPIELTVAPGATISIVYIVPQGGPPLTVTLPGTGTVALVPRS